MWRTEIYNVCDFNSVTLLIMFMQHHRNIGWRTSTEVGGTEHQRGQKGAPWPCSSYSPHPVTHLFYRCSWSSPFPKLGDDFCSNVTISRKIQAEDRSGTFVFSSQLFIVSYESGSLTRRSHRGDLHAQGSKWTGDSGLVESPCGGHGSPCFLPKANMRERKAKNRLWLCLPASTSEPALRDENYLIQVRSALS